MASKCLEERARSNWSNAVLVCLCLFASLGNSIKALVVMSAWMVLMYGGWGKRACRCDHRLSLALTLLGGEVEVKRGGVVVRVRDRYKQGEHSLLDSFAHFFTHSLGLSSALLSAQPAWYVATCSQPLNAAIYSLIAIGTGVHARNGLHQLNTDTPSTTPSLI